MGRQLPEEELFETDRQPRCKLCDQQAFYEAFDSDILNTIERELGLTAENKETLKALVTIVSNHDRVLMVAHAMNRMDELERRLEDKTSSLESKLESKLDSIDSRLWTSSWVTNVAMSLCGVLVGVVIFLVSGG